MKILIPILLWVVSLNVISKESEQPENHLDDVTSVIEPKIEDSDLLIENVDPVVIPKREKDHELFYNYVGVGLNVDVLSGEDFGGYTPGLDLRVGNSINSFLYSVFQMRGAAFYNLSSGEGGFLQTYNFQLGSRKTNDFFDPFIAAELEINKVKFSSEDFIWMNFGTQFGGRLKLNLYDVLEGRVMVAPSIGLTSIDQVIAPYLGVSGSVELMLLKALTAFVESDFHATVGSNQTDAGGIGSGAFGITVGLKFNN